MHPLKEREEKIIFHVGKKLNYSRGRGGKTDSYSPEHYYARKEFFLFFSVWGKGGCLGNGCERSFVRSDLTHLRYGIQRGGRMRELRKDMRDMGACLMCA